jgi:pimeloyl-ACP methyl ester carboxylesterase
MPTIHVNDITMYYETHGEGDPLVLIPGLATDVSEYGSIIAGLSRGYKVIALDNRGAGRTDKPDVPYSIEMMADDTAGLLAALSIERAHIVGTSMGGRIALALALRHPTLVRSLVLVSTSAKMPPPNWRRRLLLDVVQRMPLLRGSRKYPQPYYAFAHQREASRSYDCTDRLGEIHVPTLILHGRGDRIAPYRLAEEMHAGIPRSKVIAFSGGHVFFFLRPQQFIEAVSAFLPTV